jgi:hypothetical protein
MRYAVIEDNKVVNVVVATPEVAAERGWVECPKGVGVGWSFDGGTPTPPPRDIEAEWAAVRMERDRLLAESDVMVLPDRWNAMTQEQQQAWAEYRQALRDLPQTFDDPADVVWSEQEWLDKIAEIKARYPKE